MPIMDVGLDRLQRDDALVRFLRSRGVGLLAHPASVDRGLSHIGEVFARLDIVPTIFFGPEHGYGGEAQDMVGVASARDARTGAQIVSLYGDAFDDLIPQAEHLAEIDVLVVDLADVGSRYYTFVWTALLAVRAAAKAGVHTLVLDRPNPLGGRVVEGASVEPGFASFVGLEAVPVRHASTVGELCALFSDREGMSLGPDGALSILGVTGWERDQLAPSWDRPFVMTSPNMPTFETALVYPGGCLLEGTNLSEGRGTTRPFELLGAPWLDGERLARALGGLPLPGFVARPITFQPTFQKHAREICGGVQVHVTDPAAFRPYATYLAISALAHHHHPEDFRFRTERYEFIDHIPAFDLLAGSSRPREAIVAGADPMDVVGSVAEVDAAWRAPAELVAVAMGCASR